MALFNEYRKSYITACFATAVIYAFVVGENQTLIIRFADGMIYGSILFAIAYLLHPIFRFVIPLHLSSIYRIIFVSVFAAITGFLVIGVESFAIYLCFPASLDYFVPTLPLRAFISFLIIIIHCLLFLYDDSLVKSREIIESFPDKTPMDSSQANALEKTLMNPDDAVSAIIDRITVRSGNKIKIIPVESIIYIQADGDYISIHTAEGKWLKEQTMNYTENRLPPQSFVRIHRSYIVNVHQISRIERYGEKQLIVLHNNEKIKISAARYQLLRQILGI